MSFTTKKYTRPVLLANLRKVSSRNFTNVTSLANALSPRAGVRSAQFSVLKNLVGNAALRTVFNNYNGLTAKSQILSLVRNS